MSSSTDLPSVVTVDSSASRSATLFARAACAILDASSWNCSFLATKSVSQFSSTRTPALVPSSSAVTRPLPAVRSARLPASLTPFLRRFSMPSSKSPSASARAFLQSIIPAPVCSRSRFTSAAVIFAMSVRSLLRQWLSTVWCRCRHLLGVGGLGGGGLVGAGLGRVLSGGLGSGGSRLGGGGRGDLGVVGSDRGDLGLGLGRVADRGLLDFVGRLVGRLGGRGGAAGQQV